MAHSSPDSTNTGSSPVSGTYARQSFGRSNWCGTCGMRRGIDGRCPNCDAWWTSPLIQYGAPLIIASTFLILMGVSILRPKSSFLGIGKPSSIPVPVARNSGGSIPVPSPGSPGAMYGSIPVPSSRPAAYAPPPSAISVPAPVPAVAQETARLAQQQQLNHFVLSVDASVRTDDIARQQALQSARNSSVRQTSAARPMASSASMAAF